jgi:transketolase
MKQEFGRHLLKMAREDNKIVVLDGDLANSTKTDLVAENLPNQFIQCGIAESNMVGVAAGLATLGFKPWVVTFTPFLVKRALDQICVSVAQPKLNVKLIGCYSGILNGKLGKSHQGISDIAIMRTIPNMVILCPVYEEELTQMMSWANNYDGPVYIRLTRENNSVFTRLYSWNFNKATTFYNGDDITIISTGTHTYYAEQALIKLKREGIHATLIHMSTIKPLNKASIINSAVRTKAVITIEDHTIIGGLGSAVAEVLVENYPVKMLRIGIEDKNIEAGTNEELLEKYKLSIDYICEKIKFLLS